MKRSVERVLEIKTQADQAITLVQVQKQLDRIERKLDKALAISKKPQDKKVAPKAKRRG